MSEKNYNRAANYCSKSEHCISELKQKFQDWQIPAEEHDDIINRLLEERFIDERRYASAYVRDKFHFNHWGKTKISLMLKAKKISSADISEALSEIDDEEYLSSLQNLIDSQRPKIKASSEYELNAKLFRFATSHGYESNLISSILSSF